jgi:uncharacterized protein YndB with AHSA1/START domain
MARLGTPVGVSSTEYVINTTPDRVFAILADGWTYSDWVVGTAHIRDVDPSWPAPGTKLHHKAGPWPLSLKDSSTIVSCEPNRSLVMKVGLWPLGEGTVRFELEPAGANATRVTMHEDFHAGPLQWMRNKINDLVLHRRNIESLRRLADIAEREKARNPSG